MLLCHTMLLYVFGIWLSLGRCKNGREKQNARNQQSRFIADILSAQWLRRDDVFDCDDTKSNILKVYVNNSNEPPPLSPFPVCEFFLLHNFLFSSNVLSISVYFSFIREINGDIKMKTMPTDIKGEMGDRVCRMERVSERIDGWGAERDKKRDILLIRAHALNACIASYIR